MCWKQSKKEEASTAFKSTPVDQKTLDTILEAGRLAPSWANTQTWRFIIIQDNSVKTQLADSATTPGSRNNGVLKQAPVVIAACAELNRAGCREGKPTTDKEGSGSCLTLLLPWRIWCLKHKNWVSERFT